MRKRSFLKGVKGFTLIELIAVIALMTIAASFAVPMIMNNVKAKQKDIYKEACAYVIDNASAIAENISKGAYVLEGYDVTSRIGVENLLNNSNDMSFKFQIQVKDKSDNPNAVASNTKDTVIVYFKHNDAKTKAIAMGAWYVKKGEKIAEMKYDYAKAEMIGLSDAFSSHTFK